MTGTGICTCGHDKGSHARIVNDDGSCTRCACRRFEDSAPEVNVWKHGPT